MERYVVLNTYTKSDNIIIWLFEILKKFDEDMKAKFLFFLFGENHKNIYMK